MEYLAHSRFYMLGMEVTDKKLLEKGGYIVLDESTVGLGYISSRMDIFVQTNGAALFLANYSQCISCQITIRLQ